jgi:hypothetical protein
LTCPGHVPVRSKQTNSCLWHNSSCTISTHATKKIHERDRRLLKTASRVFHEIINRFLPVAILLTALLLPRAAAAASTSTVTFTLDFPNSDPEHYSITVNSDGHAKYECSARVSQDSDERESYQSEFELSPAGRARVFALAEQAHYFSGKIDSGKHRLAFTGTKKLTYQDGQRNYTAEYNYSAMPPVQELTTFFQDVSATLEFGRRLTYYHRYQKLALDDELKQMEVEAKSNALAELQAVQPILQQIFDDSSVLNVVRARAQRIIEMGKAAPAAR